MRLKCSLEVATQIILSFIDATQEQGIALISMPTWLGKVIKIFPRSQPVSETISLILSSTSLLVSGPCTRDLNGPLEVQLSSQKLILLSQPRLHLVPLAKLIFTYGKGVISLASNKQMCIYIAIVEYEFIALAPIGKETEWIRNKMLEVE